MLETMSVNGKNIHEIAEIGVSHDSNLNFTVRAFIWGLANGLHKSKTIENLQKHIILFNLI